MDRIIDYINHLLESSMDTWILGCLGVGALSLLVSFLIHRKLLAMDPGKIGRAHV